MTTNIEHNKEIMKKNLLWHHNLPLDDISKAMDEARGEGQKSERQKWIDALKRLQTYHAEVYSEASMGGVGEDSYVEFERVKDVAFYKNKVGKRNTC